MQRRVIFLPCFALFLCTLAVPGRAKANALAPPCPTATLYFYQTSLTGGQCSIGYLNYSNFGFSSSASAVGNATPPTLDTSQQILVTPTVIVNDLTSPSHGESGFSFSQVSGDFKVGTGQIANYNISYLFIIDPAPVLEGADLALDPGNVTVTQSYCNDSIFSTLAGTCTGTSGITKPQSLTVDLAHPRASITFNPPALSFGSVNTNMLLDGTGGAVSFTSATGTGIVTGMPDGTTSTATPEPGTIALAFGALFGIFQIQQRAHKRRRNLRD